MDGATTTITTSESELRNDISSEEHGTDELLDGGGRYNDGTNSKNEEREAHHVEECGEIDENMPIEKEEYEEGRGEKEEEEEEQKRFVHTLEAVSSEDSIPSSLEAVESGGVSMNEEQEEEESHDG